MACVKTDLIEQALEIAGELNRLADEGYAEGDDGCYVLCGVIRDCSYQIKNRAEMERDRHNRAPAGWQVS